MFALLASEFFCHPEERAEDGGTVVAGQFHDTGLDDETAEFDQMSHRAKNLSVLDGLN
ncbi:hypothetical protein GCM10011491_45730 [Brucella endophytica]|uniref:Uncharacterized protein n=1 Tax=Brucella endophytica TaxID=1963359 RepID=A0A916SRL5_9HYPH|nr:hypothetical protein GCM10011491_45730 [Brucella endophytica]